ncbi:c6 transcription factor protein [Diplodia corticola]|uniref:C6 transcription factor protein n=1 Tax=Diplodia corticola TaxID=236234 RepID=A0A1J9R0Y8_9PEZI|nr:c6 transcription factor protein [Diplodia corticola]OJD34273.1 c6 transcription factor protein [Diplodia corticola]
MLPQQQQPLICRANRIHAPGSSTGGGGSIMSPLDATLLEHGDAVFHHYVHVVTTVDPTHHASEQMWRWDKAVRAYAPSYDFLYYAVLTFASLHRSLLYQRVGNNTQQADNHVALASAYQSRALAGFTPAISKLSNGHAVGDTDAVLTCSSIILACSFAFPPAPGQDILDQAVQVIHLFYGTSALYERAWEAEDDGRRSGPFPSPPPSFSSRTTTTSDISSYVRDRMRAGDELGDGLPAPEAEASLERVVDAVLLRSAATTTTTTTTKSSPPPRAPSSSTFLAMLNPTLLHHHSSLPSSPPSLSQTTPDPNPAPTTPQDPPSPPSPLSTFLPPLTALRLLFRRLAARPRLHTIALHWPAHLPPAFLAALAAPPPPPPPPPPGSRRPRSRPRRPCRRRDPLALVVLAHWARCLAGFAHMWWVARWGERVVRAVVGEVAGGLEGGRGLGGGGVGGGRGGGGGAAEGGAGGEEEEEEEEERGGAAAAALAEAEANAWRACLEWPVRGLGGGGGGGGGGGDGAQVGVGSWHR